MSIIRTDIEEVTLSVDEIIPYANAPKAHTAAQISELEKSFKQFGQTKPILVTQSNVIIDGHARLIAAKNLGIKTLTVWRKLVDNPTDDQTLRITKNARNLETGFDAYRYGLELDMVQSGFDLQAFALTPPAVIEKAPRPIKTESEKIIPLSITDTATRIKFILAALEVIQTTQGLNTQVEAIDWLLSKESGER